MATRPVRLARPLRLYFEVQFVGRLFKQAKRRVMWKFAFEGDKDEHSVVLMHTLNSGKKARPRALRARAVTSRRCDDDAPPPPTRRRR